MLDTPTETQETQSREADRETQLSPEDHAFFIEHGYLVVKNVVSPDIIAEAVAFLEQAGFEGDVGEANYRPRMGDAVHACVTERVHGALQELLGSDYVLPRKTGAVDMPRPFTPDKPWQSQSFHVDSDYPTRMPTEDILSHFIFLTPVRSHGGAFQYAPGSAQRYFAVMGDNPENLKVKTPLPEISGTIHEFLAEPGDMLIMTHLGGHAGSSNVTDPQTRHALLDRYDTPRRLVPGLKPFEEMSSVEKIYSARYLREERGMDIPPPGLILNAETDTALREGVAVAPDIISYETFLENAHPGLLFVSQSAPGHLQRATTQDFTQWKAGPALEMPNAVLTHLHSYKRDDGVSLFVGGTFPAAEARLLTGLDSARLSVTETMPGAAFAFGHFTTEFGSRFARGRIVFVQPAERPNRLECCWGKTWAEAMKDNQRRQTAELPEGSAFLDAFIAPTNAGPPFALIADVQAGGTGASVPQFSVSRDVAQFEDPLQPLLYDGETPPWCIRLCARARSFWLVNFLRVVESETRLFWGVIDWENTPAVLTQIRTAAGMQEAHCIVGWI